MPVLRFNHRCKLTFYLTLGIILVWFLSLGIRLSLHSTHKIDAILVLGGSIQREMYLAQSIAERPTIPVLISGGSFPPCIRLVFDRYQAPVSNIWLESCARSTFGNFFYAIPILKSWQTHKVLVITSGNHAIRAIKLARILLGAQGIWVEWVTVTEPGIPGNTESYLKTGLDLFRSLIWAMISQIYHPTCSQVISLKSVDLTVWYSQGFHCEHQADLQDRIVPVQPKY